jgi:hypothetical protein
MMKSSKFIFLNNSLNNNNINSTCRLFQLNRFSSAAKKNATQLVKRTNVVLNKSINNSVACTFSNTTSSTNKNDAENASKNLNGALILSLFGLIGIQNN